MQPNPERGFRSPSRRGAAALCEASIAFFRFHMRPADIDWKCMALQRHKIVLAALGLFR